MDAGTLEYLHSILTATARKADWKAALDMLLSSVRSEFVYDNVAVYSLDPHTNGLDVVYARAVGRGKQGEADVSWGEGIAGEVIAREQAVVHDPSHPPGTDRLDLPHLMGLPLSIGGRWNAALVFVRFGGPKYSQEHRWLAALVASSVASLLERKALQQARSELESVQRQMRLQDDFVSTISHELRTPLGFIKGYSTSLLREDTTWDQKTQREFLTIIDDETDRLTHLIENMLESARLQSKTIQFKFQPLRFEALIRDVAIRVNTHHPELQVNFDFAAVSPIQGDGVRLSQVFENLFSNALKYAPGSPLTISLRQVDKSLRTAFADRGPGIPEDFLPFIFERFYRVPAVASIATGTGLGLYICKQIILAHHGKIWAESVVGKGTTFFVELPINSSAP